MLTIDDIIRLSKYRAAYGDYDNMPVPRDRKSARYYRQKQLQADLDEKSEKDRGSGD